MSRLTTTALLMAFALASTACTSAPSAQCRIPAPPAALMQDEPSLIPLMDSVLQISGPESSGSKHE